MHCNRETLNPPSITTQHPLHCVVMMRLKVFQVFLLGFGLCASTTTSRSGRNSTELMPVDETTTITEYVAVAEDATHGRDCLERAVDAGSLERDALFFVERGDTHAAAPMSATDAMDMFRQGGSPIGHFLEKVSDDDKAIFSSSFVDIPMNESSLVDALLAPADELQRTLSTVPTSMNRQKSLILLFDTGHPPRAKRSDEIHRGFYIVPCIFFIFWLLFNFFSLFLYIVRRKNGSGKLRFGWVAARSLRRRS